MQAQDSWQSPNRFARFEPFEERLALSAEPVADFVLGIGEQLEQQYGEVTAAFADVHELTGVHYARETYGLSGKGQTVAVIDSGIAYDHMALGQGFGADHRVVGGWDFAENDADPYDDGPAGFHGTHVAGIVGSQDGVHRGVAPGVDLVGLRVFNDQGQGQLSWVENALQWVHENRNAFANPITAINLSLGTKWNSSSIPVWAQLEDEFAQLKQDGIFIAVAAGNAFQQYLTTGLSYPAVSPFVVPVASVDASGNLSSFSQRDARVLAAPGRAITSTVPDYVLGADGWANDFAAASGTSMAAPYVAGVSALIREAMQSVGYVNVTQDTIYEHLCNTADVFHDTATNSDYFRINVRTAVDSLLAGDERHTSVDLGRVESTRLSDQQFAGGETWYQFTATRDGMLTAEALFSRAAGDLRLQLYSPDNQLLATAKGGPGSERLDARVVAGGTYRLQVSGTNADVDLRLTNLVEVRDGQWHLYETSGDDSFVVNAADRTVSVNGVQYSSQELGSFRAVSIHASAGTDSLTFQGSSANEQLTLSPGSFVVTGSPFEVQAVGVDKILASGGGGRDVALLYDSAGDDRFLAHPERAVLQGTGFHHEVLDFDRVYALATLGGNDSTELYDSAGNDTFRADRTYATLSGSGFYVYAKQFDQVTAFATRGGSDVARLYDSSGDDTFVADPVSATLSGRGFTNAAQRFDRVYAYASSGTDVARLYDSAGNDTFVADSQTATLTGPGFHNAAERFDRVVAYATIGDDNARLFDSAGNDRFVADGRRAVLSGTGYEHAAWQFDRVQASATRGGTDVARLQGTARGNTVLVGNFRESLDAASLRDLALQGPAYRTTTQEARQVVLSGLEVNRSSLLGGKLLPIQYYFRAHSSPLGEALGDIHRASAVQAEELGVDYLFQKWGERG